MIKAEENFINLKKKVDITIKLLNIITIVCSVIFIVLFFMNMYFNWLYRGPWDDSLLKDISFKTLLVDIPCLLVSGILSYNIKK